LSNLLKALGNHEYPFKNLFLSAGMECMYRLLCLMHFATQTEASEARNRICNWNCCQVPPAELNSTQQLATSE